MKFETEIGGRKLIIETGELAGQANGSCTAQYGETVVLATATMGQTEREGIDYFPLSVDYEERFYAAGKIKGSRFIKRETRPPDEAILADRLVDRSLRPLFNQDLRREVQIILIVLSVDQENDPDLVALYAASAAMVLSNIPWDGPVAGVRIGRVDGEWVINPTYLARSKSDLDLVVCGKDGRVIMIEAGAQEIDEETIFRAVEFGGKHLRKINDFLNELQEKVGRPKDLSVFKEISEDKKEIEGIVKDFLKKRAKEILFKNKLLTKADRIKAAENLRVETDKVLNEKGIGKEKREKAVNLINKLIYQEVGQAILNDKQRIDGRKLDEIRPVKIQVGVLPRVHGSAIFERGETQVLSTVTLGAPGMEQYLDTMEESGRKRFMHHYNFPPFCSGEVAPLRMTGRRETGHGALVEKGLLPILPDKELFPYTIRLVSEVLSSNGSTSMASVCASCLALMDAGVPIKKPVAGIAIGLASEEDESGIKKYKTFADLQDLEDGPGGMDFKVIGSREGITAIQMDTKTHGLSLEIIKDALTEAKKSRDEILEKMGQILAEPRKELSPYAPRISAFRIDPAKIREVVGPGGRVINDIIAKTGVTIDIEQDGLVVVTSVSDEALTKAVDWIKNLTREIKVGEVFQGKVNRILDFGVFVELVPGQEGMVHVSELAPYRVRHPGDVVKIGEIIPVKVIEIDQEGRINLSVRAAREENYQPRPKPPRAARTRDEYSGRKPYKSRGYR